MNLFDMLEEILEVEDFMFENGLDCKNKLRFTLEEVLVLFIVLGLSLDRFTFLIFFGGGLNFDVQGL